MKNRDTSPLPVDTWLENAPGRALLCRVMDVDLGVGFGDLTVRCLAHSDGQVELLDLMFAAIDVQILESAIVDTRMAAIAVGRSSNCGSTACSDGQCRSSNQAGTSPSRKA